MKNPESIKPAKESLYLEISGRQTGKTTRLFAAALSWWSQGGTAVIHCDGSVMKDRIYGMARGCARDKGGMIAKTFIVTAKAGRVKLPKNAGPVRHFYDEFDFQKGVEIYADGYYATTPRKLRKKGSKIEAGDVLRELVKKKRGKFVRVESKAKFEWVKAFQDQEEKVIQCEKLGRFLA